MSRALSTTSYAILGLLAVRSWTPYELTRQMQFSLGRFWPRAASKLYEEPKKLAEHGLATAVPDSTGTRPRTRYEITAAGREALRAWLETPAQMPTLEAEPLLRVFLAEHGSRAALVATLEQTRSWAGQRILEDARIAREYRDGGGRFPDRIAQLTLVGRFLSDLSVTTYEWSGWALRTVEAWAESPARDDETLALLIARADLVPDGVEEPGRSRGSEKEQP